MILEIGIGILSFGIGLFTGSFLNNLKHKKSVSKSQNEDLSIFAKWAQEKSKRELLEKEQKEKYEKLRQEALIKAQEQAYKEVQPELVEQLKQQEIRKITGQDKKDKLQKFADLFATSSSSSNTKTNNSGGSYSEEKLNRMLGKSNVITPTKIYDAQGYALEQEDRSTDKFINNDKINMMLGKQSFENNNSKSMRYSSTSKYQEQKAEEERLKRLVR